MRVERVVKGKTEGLFDLGVIYLNSPSMDIVVTPVAGHQ